MSSSTSVEHLHCGHVVTQAALGLIRVVCGEIKVRRVSSRASGGGSAGTSERLDLRETQHRRDIGIVERDDGVDLILDRAHDAIPHAAHR